MFAYKSCTELYGDSYADSDTCRRPHRPPERRYSSGNDRNLKIKKSKNLIEFACFEEANGGSRSGSQAAVCFYDKTFK
jgi:hypothetical protein